MRKLWVPLTLTLWGGLTAALVGLPAAAGGDVRPFGVPVRPGFAAPCAAPAYAPPAYQAPYCPPPYYPPEYLTLLLPMPLVVDPRVSYVHNGVNVLSQPAAPVTGNAAAAPARKSDRVGDLSVAELKALIDDRVGRAAPVPADGPPPVPGFRAGPTRTSAAVVIGESCGRCHSGDKPAGGFKIFEADGRGALTAEGVGAVVEKVRAGDMPPAKSPERAKFTADKRQVILAELGGAVP